jgi:hypothetical protein
MKPVLVRLVGNLVDELPDDTEVDLNEVFACEITMEIFGYLSDTPRCLRSPLLGWSLAIFFAQGPQLTREQT